MAETPIDAEALYDLTHVADAAVDPAGDRVAVLTRESDPEDDETVASLSGRPRRRHARTTPPDPGLRREQPRLEPGRIDACLPRHQGGRPRAAGRPQGGL